MNGIMMSESFESTSTLSKGSSSSSNNQVSNCNGIVLVQNGHGNSNSNHNHQENGLVYEDDDDYNEQFYDDEDESGINNSTNIPEKLYCCANMSLNSGDENVAFRHQEVDDDNNTAADDVEEDDQDLYSEINNQLPYEMDEVVDDNNNNNNNDDDDSGLHQQQEQQDVLEGMVDNYNVEEEEEFMDDEADEDDLQFEENDIIMHEPEIQLEEEEEQLNGDDNNDKEHNKCSENMTPFSIAFSNKLKTLQEDHLNLNQRFKDESSSCSFSSSNEFTTATTSTKSIQASLCSLRELAFKKCLNYNSSKNNNNNDKTAAEESEEINLEVKKVDAVKMDASPEKANNSVQPEIPIQESVSKEQDDILKMLPKSGSTENKDKLNDPSTNQEKENSSVKKLPSYVQEIIEKDESLKRLLKTGCVTISQINEPPSSPPIPENGSAPSKKSTVTCTPVILAPVQPTSALFSADWTSFPSASKLIQLSLLATEEAAQDKIPSTAVKHLSSLPTKIKENAKESKPLKKSMPARITETIVDNKTKKFSNPSKSSQKLPVGMQQHLKRRPPISKVVCLPKAGPSAICFSNAQRILKNGLHVTKVPVNYEDHDNNEIDDDTVLSSDDFNYMEVDAPMGSADQHEFDPTRFLEVSLQETDGFEEEDDYYNDDYEPILPSTLVQPMLATQNSNNIKNKSQPPPSEDDLRRKYKCPHCLKGFCWSTDLKRHILTHTGERPFSCNYCSANFTRKFLMQKHVKKYHGNLLDLETKVNVSPKHIQSINPKDINPMKVYGKPAIKLPYQKNSELTSLMHNKQNGSGVLLNGHRNGINSIKNGIVEMNPKFINRKNGQVFTSKMPSPSLASIKIPNLHSAALPSKKKQSEEEAKFPSKPINPIVINISSKTGGSGVGGGFNSGSMTTVKNQLNCKSDFVPSVTTSTSSADLKEPRRINQSLVKQLIRANAQIKLAAAAAASSRISPEKTEDEPNNGNLKEEEEEELGNENNIIGNDRNNMIIMNGSSSSTKNVVCSNSTIPRLKR